MSDDHVFVIIPAFNEARTIGPVVSEVRSRFPNVVVIDDGSRDDTARLAGLAGGSVVRHLINRGQGAALQTGIEYALQQGAECIVTFDADGQHRVEDIPALVASIDRGEAEFVLGSRFLGGAAEVPPGRRWLLRGAVVFTRVFSGLKLTDTHSGLRAFTRRAAGRIRLRLDRMAHASELMDQIGDSGLPYREVPITVRYTDYSMAKGQRSFGAFRVAFDYLVGRLLG